MESVKIIGDRNGRVWPGVLEAVRESRAAGLRTIVYVPEQYTLQAERDLIQGLGLPGLLDLDVMSPRKLREQVRELAGQGSRRPLTPAGAVMSVHRILSEHSRDMAYYRDMSGLYGAAGRLGGALEELRDSGLTLEELEEWSSAAPTGAERAKMHDLALLWRCRDQLLEGRFDDAKAAWTDTVRRLESSDLLTGAALFVYGFDAIRPDLRELIQASARFAADVRVFMVMDEESAPDGRIFAEQRRSAAELSAALAEQGTPCRTVWPRRPREDAEPALAWLERYLFADRRAPWPENPSPALTMFSAPAPSEEVSSLAEALCRWHAEGIAWSEMAVALPKGTDLLSSLCAALRLREIPFTCSRKTPAAAHGLCRMLLGALRCAAAGYNTDDLLDTARSGFSALLPEEAMRLETYVLAHGIEYGKWDHPFTLGEDAEDAEALRLCLLEPLEQLRAALRSAPDGRASAEAVARFLQRQNAHAKLREREQRLLEGGAWQEAVADRQIWKLIMELLDEFQALLGAVRLSPRETAELLECAVSQASLSALPEEEAGVLVGEIGHMLSGDIQALAVPDLREGTLSDLSLSWLTDAERSRLETASRRTVGMSAERESLLRRVDFYRTLSLPRRRLRLSWSLRGEDGSVRQPEAVVDRIRELFPALETEGGVLSRTRLSDPLSRRAALDGLSDWLWDLREGRVLELPARWRQALVSLTREEDARPVREMLRRAVPSAGEEQIRLEPVTARRLFMTDRLSVSRLERYAACPYRHFLEYGLRPVRRETFTFEDSDAGTFFHAVLDQYMKNASAEPGWPDLPEERIDQMLDAVCAEQTRAWENGPLADDALGRWQGGEMLRRVRFAAKALTRFAGNSDFRTVATELSFGEQEGLPPLIVPLRDGTRAVLRGTIDRIDRYENGEGIWLRVVDNKSSSRKPSPDRMADGEQLQLMIYLRAATEAQPGARPAGALYFPMVDKEVNVLSDSPEEQEQARMRTVRMKGLAVAEPDVLRAMDRDIAPYSVDQVFKKDGSLRADADWAVEEPVLRGLMDAAVKKAADLCSDMREGIVDVAPRGDKEEESLCAFCEYRPICHVRPRDYRPRDPNLTYRDVARS